MKTTLFVYIFLIAGTTISTAQTNPSLQLDTISIRGSFIRDQNIPNIKFDSLVIELYQLGNRLAVIPGDFRSFINKELIEKTEMSTEAYNGKKILLRIQMFVTPEQRKKVR